MSMQSSELEPRLFLPSDIDPALELNNANAPAVGEIDRPTLEFLIEHSLYSFAIGSDSLHAFCITSLLGHRIRALTTSGSRNNIQILCT
jgi:hypothetical protein